MAKQAWHIIAALLGNDLTIPLLVKAIQQYPIERQHFLQFPGDHLAIVLNGVAWRVESHHAPHDGHDQAGHVGRCGD